MNFPEKFVFISFAVCEKNRIENRRTTVYILAKSPYFFPSPQIENAYFFPVFRGREAAERDGT